jgi:biotin operon repressor
MTPHKTAPQWLENAVIVGLQELLVLRLERAPAADTINAVVDVWLHALMTANTTWVSALDAWRVANGFAVLLRARDEWPAPKALLDAMPARVMPVALPAPTSNSVSPAVRQQIDTLVKKVRRPAGDVGRHELLAVMARHIGAQHGVSAEQLARALNTSARHIRTLVTELRMDGEHVCVTPGEGYFMAETDADVTATCEFLKSRALKSLLLASRMTKVSIPDLVGQLKLPT